MELGNMLFGHSRGEFPVPRTEDLYMQLVRLFDAYAPDRDNSWREYGVAFENEVFSVMPYWWGDCTCGMEEKEEVCLDDCAYNRPNFHYKPEDIRVDWYKYPLRGSYSNILLTPKLLEGIVDVCIASLECVVVGTQRETSGR